MGGCYSGEGKNGRVAPAQSKDVGRRNFSTLVRSARRSGRRKEHGEVSRTTILETNTPSEDLKQSHLQEIKKEPTKNRK